jgi:hydrogenase nickel incorporation protein HypA/HybF
VTIIPNPEITLSKCYNIIMHELGIAQDFWAVIKQQAKHNDLKKVTKIVIVLGEASGIDRDFLVHSFKDHILPGTFAENAKLEIIPTPLAAKCNSCSKELTTGMITALNCPACGSSDLEIISGKETYVQSIEGE